MQIGLYSKDLRGSRRGPSLMLLRNGDEWDLTNHLDQSIPQISL